MPTYDKPTYQQLIDEVVGEVNEDAAIARKPFESFQSDILNAEQKIADEYDIKEEYELRLTDGVDEYFFQDRPAIVNATNASPISIEANSPHGLSDKGIILIRNVQGNDAANGTFRIGYTDTLNFTLKEFARIVGVTVSGTTVTATTEKNHGWSTADSILIDTSSAYIDGTFSITVTGLKTFTFTHTVPDGTYNGLGIASKNTTGTGNYTSGGRFWKENELPTHLGRFDYGEVNVQGFRGTSDVVDNRSLSGDESWDSFFNPTYPAQMTFGTKNGRRYLRFSVTPTQSQTIRLFGFLKISPHLYYDDPLSATIHLDAEFSEAIKYFVKSKAYGFLKDRKNSVEEMNSFLGWMRDKKFNTVTPKRIQIID